MDRLELGAALPLPVPMGYRVRAYRQEDWDCCVELMLATPDPAYDTGPWDRELCLSSLAFSADEHGDYPGGRGQLIFQDEELASIALASATGYLNQVYTLASHQRRGLASAAVTRVFAALHRQGVERCFLMVYKGNEGAVRCYRRLGFVPAELPSFSED